LNCLHQTFQG